MVLKCCIFVEFKKYLVNVCFVKNNDYIIEKRKMSYFC